MKLHTQSVLASLLGMAAVLAGCKVGPDFKRPDPPAAERYTSQKLQVEPGSSANVDQQIALGASPDREDCAVGQSTSRNKKGTIPRRSVARGWLVLRRNIDRTFTKRRIGLAFLNHSYVCLFKGLMNIDAV